MVVGGAPSPELLRLLPSPPLHLPDDEAVERHSGRLHELLEVAYSLRTRPAADIIQTVGQFCRGITSHPAPSGVWVP